MAWVEWAVSPEQSPSGPVIPRPGKAAGGCSVVSPVSSPPPGPVKSPSSPSPAGMLKSAHTGSEEPTCASLPNASSLHQQLGTSHDESIPWKSKLLPGKDFIYFREPPLHVPRPLPNHLRLLGEMKPTVCGGVYSTGSGSDLPSRGRQISQEEGGQSGLLVPGWMWTGPACSWRTKTRRNWG